MKAIDYKKKNIDCFAKTKDLRNKRADQIATDLKQEFQESSHQYATKSDSLEEVFENREQIELSRFYEQLPKPTQLAMYEFENGQVYFKDTTDEE